MERVKIKHLVLSLTGSCNYSCEYCYASDHYQGRLSLEQAYRAVDMAAHSCRGEAFVLQFTGGEPLLAFDLLQAVVEYIRTKGYRAILQVQTNGSLLTKEIALYLRANRVAIGVSLDGLPPVNDTLRKIKDGQGGTGATVAGISLLAQLNIAIGITCVVTAANVAHLAGIVEFAYYLGNVRRLGFDLLRGQGRGSRLQPAGAKEVAAAMAALTERADQLGRLAGYSLCFTQQEAVERLLRSERCSEQGTVKTMLQSEENSELGTVKSILQAEESSELGNDIQELGAKQAGSSKAASEDCRASGMQWQGFSHCYAMRGEAAFVDAKGDIYACSSLLGNPEYYLGNTTTGIDPQRAAAIGQKIKRAMEFCLCCPSFKHCGGGCYARWQSHKAVEECALKKFYIQQGIRRL